MPGRLLRGGHGRRKLRLRSVAPLAGALDAAHRGLEAQLFGPQRVQLALGRGDRCLAPLCGRVGLVPRQPALHRLDLVVDVLGLVRLPFGHGARRR
eukprot:10309371-Lingulodinium_polyedra.AAC.1